MTLALAGISMPNFWLGPLMAILFAVWLGWLPVSGSGTAAHLVLPAVTLGAALSAILARMTRASLLEELRELYVVAARARGLSGSRAVLRHAFRNSLIPVVTIIGLQFGAVLTGTIITETIFAWPGLGRLLIQGVRCAHLADGRDRRGVGVVDRGEFFGSIAGYFGGRVDDVISRIIDVLMAFPGILLAIALVAVLGPSLVNVVLALS